MFNRAVAVVTLLALATGMDPAQALTFQFTFTPGTTAQQQAAFIAAGDAWSAQVSDPVTVKLTVGTSALSPGVLVNRAVRHISYTYVQARNALAADATSLTDGIAVANLSAGSGFGVLINRTSDSPNGALSATPYVDIGLGANNTQLRLTAANARALGLAVSVGGIASCTDCDASIQFSATGPWDYDPVDGIAGNAYDFTGLAVREIGTALGFVSGVDILDINGSMGFLADLYTFVSPLDLFRWSTLSTASNVIDWAADNRDKYFSLDRGVTAGPSFSTGRFFGDGQQASYWKDGRGLGVMDSLAVLGERLTMSSFDVMALDAVGWNGPPTAATVHYRAIGTVEGTTGNVALLPIQGAEGDRFVMDFAYDTGQPDTDTFPGQGTYPILGMTVRVAGVSVPITGLGSGAGRIEVGDGVSQDSWGVTACPQGNCPTARPLDEARLVLFYPGSTINSDALVPPPVIANATFYQFLLFSLNDDATEEAFLTGTLESVQQVFLTDTDNDGVNDLEDNCVNAPNGPLIPDTGGGSQRDADGDGYGNLCDADLNNSGLVTAADFSILRSVLNQSAGANATAAKADLNGSGTVTAADYSILRAKLNLPPGPSGVRPP